LDENELAKLVTGFKRCPALFALVALCASTGLRRNEALAARWSDLDAERRTLRIERAWEPSKRYGLILKGPKTARGVRTIDISDDVLALLLREKETHQRIAAGVPDDVPVNLSLIKLPADALVFPHIPGPGEDFSFTKPRNPKNVSNEFNRRAKRLGFTGFSLHMLRHTHSTALLDKGMPVHQVAARIGDDPATLLKVYARLTKKKHEGMSETVNMLGTKILGS
jgi:integrase